MMRVCLHGKSTFPKINSWSISSEVSKPGVEYKYNNYAVEKLQYEAEHIGTAVRFM